MSGESECLVSQRVGESVCLSGESVCLSGESVCLHSESLCLVSQRVGESLCVNCESICLHGKTACPQWRVNVSVGVYDHCNYKLIVHYSKSMYECELFYYYNSFM